MHIATRIMDNYKAFKNAFVYDNLTMKEILLQISVSFLKILKYTWGLDPSNLIPCKINIGIDIDNSF